MITFKTNLGDIKIELDFENAPKTAENFKSYCVDGYYVDTIFHRVIKGFMAQGGGFEKMGDSMVEKSTRASIQNEANNGLTNARGTLAMARTQEPHSASAQFFINLVDNTFLDFKSESVQGWGYCVFAKVVEGMDVVDKMTLEATGRSGHHDDVPVNDIIVESVEVA